MSDNKFNSGRDIETAQVQRPPHVGIALDEARDSLDRLASTIDVLTGRLAPVLLPDFPEAAAMGKDGSPGSDLAITIAELSRRINSCRRQISDLIDRMDI